MQALSIRMSAWLEASRDPILIDFAEWHRDAERGANRRHRPEHSAADVPSATLTFDKLCPHSRATMRHVLDSRWIDMVVQTE